MAGLLPYARVGSAAPSEGAAAGTVVPATRLDPVDPVGVARIREVLAGERRRWLLVTGALLTLVAALAVVMMCVGSNNTYAPAEVWRVLAGGDAADHVTRAVWDYRLPRVVAALLVGFAFGVAGNTFQVMLRNPLASPDVIGITSGSSVAAVFCLLILHMGPGQTSAYAVAAALVMAGAIYCLANVGGFSSGKLILVGLGMQAITKAFTSFLLLKGAEFDVPSALRWLSGSLNGVTLPETAPLVAVMPLAAVAVALGRRLRILELGEEATTTLGASPRPTRAALILCTVAMIAFGTAVTGPIACVTFLAGPIASRMVGSSSRATVPAGLVAVALVMAADIVGQHYLGTRFPVGVVTGIMGTPYLLYLLVRMNRKGSL